MPRPDSSRPPGSNPRGPRLGPRRAPGRTPRPAFSLWYVLLILLALALAQAYFLVPAAQTIPYSEFKTDLHNGQVAEVKISEQEITGTLKATDKAGPKAFRAVRVDDPKLVEDLDAQHVKYTGEATNRWLPDLIGWVLPLAIFVGIWIFFIRRMGGAEGGVMSFARSRAKIYAEDDVKVTFADVAGIDEAAGELREIVDFLKEPKKYTALGGRIPKGVLLVGPPGTGKTLLARAVAGEARVPFFSLSGSEFVEMFVGVGAARVRDLFAQAELKAPCIVFIDELDALGRTRSSAGPFGGHEEREQTLNQLLAEMDGFDSRKGVIIMAATNRPEVLDPALLRPGRFDRQVLVDKPDAKGREAILKIHTRNVRMAADVDLKVVAARTVGFAGADLANLVNEAALLAAREGRPAVDMPAFENAIDRLVAGLEKKRVMSDKERRIVAYHESGHAIVASSVPGTDPVHKVSIVQRGFGALGYTMQLPLEDRYLMTESDLHGQLAVLLGGRAAEEVALAEISTGAQNDLQRATDVARAMVTEFGMSDRLGPVTFEAQKRSPFLQSALPPERGAYSEAVAREIDDEVKRLVEDAHAHAREILSARRGTLDLLATRLLEKEVIEAAELQALLTTSTTSAEASPAAVPAPPLHTP